MSSKSCSRRNFLAGVGATAALSLSTVGTVSAAAYGSVIDVVDEGADNTGSSPINPVLERLRHEYPEDVLFAFPPGTYAMDSMFRFAGFDHVAFAGDDATVVPTPDFDMSAPWLFRLGVLADPGHDLSFHGFTFDFTAPETGMRVLEAQVTHGLSVRDVDVVGTHDTGTFGPALFNVTDPDGSGEVQRFSVPDGGEFSVNTPGTIAAGPTGVLVSPYHRGTLWLRDLDIGGFPDNGVYAATPNGRVLVEGGRFRNSNVSNVRIAGDGSRIRGARIEVDRNRPNDENQRGIRLDSGRNLRVENVSIDLSEPNGYAISVMDDAESAHIENTEITVGDRPNSAIVVSPQAGWTTIVDTDIHFNGSNYALAVFGDDAGPVVGKNLSISGWADGRGGRSAILCNRNDCAFYDLSVYQPGSQRRAIDVHGDDCYVRGGTVMASTYPVYNTGSRNRYESLAAASWGGSEGAYLYRGSDLEVVDCVFKNGVREGSVSYAANFGNTYS
ncbi:MAG: right-handed parallel beta-helix repeat-containing protein [Halobacteriota archaeon]